MQFKHTLVAVCNETKPTKPLHNVGKLSVKSGGKRERLFYAASQNDSTVMVALPEDTTLGSAINHTIM